MVGPIVGFFGLSPGAHMAAGGAGVETPLVRSQWRQRERDLFSGAECFFSHFPPLALSEGNSTFLLYLLPMAVFPWGSRASTTTTASEPLCSRILHRPELRPDLWPSLICIGEPESFPSRVSNLGPAVTFLIGVAITIRCVSIP